MTRIYLDLLLINQFQFSIHSLTTNPVQISDAWNSLFGFFTALWWFLFPFFAKQYTHCAYKGDRSLSLQCFITLSIVLIQIKWDVTYNLAKLLDMKHRKKWLERSAVNFHESHKNSEKTFMQRLHLHNHSFETVSKIYSSYSELAESQQNFSRISAESQQNLSRISVEHLQNLSRILADPQQNLSRILAES